MRAGHPLRALTVACFLALPSLSLAQGQQPQQQPQPQQPQPEQPQPQQQPPQQPQPQPEQPPAEGEQEPMPQPEPSPEAAPEPEPGVDPEEEAEMPVSPEDGFQIAGIQVRGLQRINEETVLSYLPLEIGDLVGPPQIRSGMRELYQTGFFEDIRMKEDEGILIIEVEERPTIGMINISGNRQIEDDDLFAAMREVGIAEGRVLNRQLLDQMEMELFQVYYGQGRYGVSVETNVEEFDENQVAVSLEIKEGRPAYLRKINFVGNEAFDDDRLKGRMELTERSWRTLMGQRDQYARERLGGDLEELQYYYMDRGYADFDLDSIQVSLSEDRRDVYLTINVDEGEVYTIRDVDMIGEYPVPEEELRSLIQVSPGDTFSMSDAEASADFIERRLSASGYAHAEVRPIPDLHREDREVSMTFLVEPGNRIYVRNIDIRGTEDTDDETYRRELRQLERAPLQSSLVDRSRTRMRRQPFVQHVDIQERPVPGSEDEVDLEVNIQERQFGEFNIGAGYGDLQGFLLNTSIRHSNLFGRGYTGQAQLERNRLGERYNFEFTDPFTNLDGVSRTVSAFYENQEFFAREQSPADLSMFGGSVRWGYPVSEFDSLRWGLSGRSSEFISIPGTSQEMRNFIRDHGDPFEIQDDPDTSDPTRPLGSKMDSMELNLGWVRDTRNRAIFADQGQRRQLSVDYALPGFDLEYWGVRLEQTSFLPLGNDFTYQMRGRMDYQDTYGDTETVPPFRHVFAGGSRSVRGWRAASLGPRDNIGNPFGGTIRTTFQNELILPDFFGDEDAPGAPEYQIAFFLDAGYVWEDRRDVDMGDMRYSVGLSGTWMTPMGVLRFSVAEPLNDTQEDRDRNILDRFQFEMGTGF